MRSHLVVVLLSSLGLFACGGANKNTKDEANPWGNFTGKYSEPKASRAKAESDDTHATGPRRIDRSGALVQADGRRGAIAEKHHHAAAAGHLGDFGDAFDDAVVKGRIAGYRDPVDGLRHDIAV